MVYPVSYVQWKLCLYCTKHKQLTITIASNDSSMCKHTDLKIDDHCMWELSSVGFLGCPDGFFRPQKQQNKTINSYKQCLERPVDSLSKKILPDSILFYVVSEKLWDKCLNISSMECLL